MAQTMLKGFCGLKAAATALAIGLAIGTVNTPAFAAQSVPATPSHVEFNGNTNQLLLVINGVMYVGKTGAPGCGANTAKTIDTVKTWTNLAQAALLSGKKLLVWYDTGGTCGTTNYIASLVLQSS